MTYLKQQFKAHLGYGDGSKYPYGEYLYSEGMMRTQNGITPAWKMTAAVDSGTLTTLGVPNWYAEASPDGTARVYQVDGSGNIFRSQVGFNSWSLAYKPGVPTGGNGLITDQKNRLLYLTTRYMGKYDGSPDYTTGTIAVTNGSAAVVGTGTTFIAGDVDRRIVINGVWYTISAFTDATHVTLSSVYAGITASGLSYAITRGWIDKFKDFGADIAPSNEYRPADLYEDWVVMGNGNKVALYNVTDDSFNASAFDLPSGFVIRTIKSNRAGILIGANVGNRCVLVLWTPGNDRSIAPWIWKKGNVQSIAADDDTGDWIVVTNRGIYQTNGYATQPIAPIPDAKIDSAYLNVHPQGAQVLNSYLFLANTANLTNRIRGGLWFLNLQTQLWEYAPVANGGTVNNSMRCIFFDSLFQTHVAWVTQIPSLNYLGYITNEPPSRAFVITAPIGSEDSDQRVADAVKLSLGISPLNRLPAPFSFRVSVKLANFKRPMWTYAQQSGTAVALNQIKVDGTIANFNHAEVGDEVTIMEGANAGQSAHIVGISNQDTSNEVWVLDTPFTALTEASVIISVLPFQLVSRQTLTSVTELKDLLFNATKKLKGKQFFIKIVFDSITTVAPELLGGELIHNNLGVT